MIEINPQYINDTAGKKLVVLPKKQFDCIMEEPVGLEDIKRYDAAKKIGNRFLQMLILLLNKLRQNVKSMYKLRIEKAVQKSLEKINEPYYSKIKKAILSLAKNPRPLGIHKFNGS